tara:strand:+ start:2067 stop:2489 length:423 start_codon:yes stop_codon:yes gene_type:complete
MTDKFQILGRFIKDMSSETKNTETYIFVKDRISQYQLDIKIHSKAIKNNMVEINTILKFEDKKEAKYKSYFEMTYATIVKISDKIKDKKDLERIILCDAQIKIYPDLKKSFLNLLHDSGYSDVKFEKKIDFEKLYNQRFN